MAYMILRNGTRAKGTPVYRKREAADGMVVPEMGEHVVECPKQPKYKPGWTCDSCGTDFSRHDDVRYGTGSTCNDPRFTLEEGSGNARHVRRTLGGIHCMAPIKDALAPFKRTLEMKTLHPVMREGIRRYIIREHLRNRAFGIRMGVAPSERLIARVMSGELKPEDIGL